VGQAEEEEEEACEGWGKTSSRDRRETEKS